MIQLIAIAIVSVIIIGAFFTYDRMNETYYIEYTEGGNVDYKVQLIENDFFEEEWIESNRAYISSLINSVSADFNYRLNIDKENVAFDYEYGIDAQLLVIDNRSGDAIFNPVYELVPKSKISIDSKNEIRISERVFIDYVNYNKIASEFVEIYNLTNTSSLIRVTLRVNIVSRCKDFAQNSQNSYYVSLDIPLVNNTLSIKMSSSVPDAESKVIACPTSVNQGIFKIIGIIAAVIDAILVSVLIGYTYLTRNDDINYAIKVQRLVSAYRSYIQQLDEKFDTSGYQTVKIKTFSEMLGIRDTLQSPILMFENKDQTMTEFIIPTSNNILYVFDVKVDNYDVLYSGETPADDEEE